MSKGTQFAMAFVPWVESWGEMGLSGTQMRVLLLLMANMQRDKHGNFYAWRQRSEIANILGLREETVRKAISALKDKGAIKIKGKSYSGRCQEYWIMPKIKVALQIPPISEKGCPTDAEKGTPHVPKRGVPTGPPIIPIDGASASLSQPSARNRYKQADGTENAVL